MKNATANYLLFKKTFQLSNQYSSLFYDTLATSQRSWLINCHINDSNHMIHFKVLWMRTKTKFKKKDEDFGRRYLPFRSDWVQNIHICVVSTGMNNFGSISEFQKIFSIWKNGILLMEMKIGLWMNCMSIRIEYFTHRWRYCLETEYLFSFIHSYCSMYNDDEIRCTIIHFINIYITNTQFSFCVYTQFNHALLRGG